MKEGGGRGAKGYTDAIRGTWLCDAMRPTIKLIQPTSRKHARGGTLQLLPAVGETRSQVLQFYNHAHPPPPLLFLFLHLSGPRAVVQ